MKRVFIMSIAIIICSILIFLCAYIRSTYSFTNEIKTHMKERINTLISQVDIICAFEFTPFIWSEQYVGSGYTTTETLQELLDHKTIKHLKSNEYDHRSIYLLYDDYVFDTENVSFNNQWVLWYYKNIIYPDDWFVIETYLDDSILLIDIRRLTEY